MIEADHLTRQFGRTTAVSNVSFDIGSNEVVGLLGPNGAGKTTIMRMLSGYLEPTAGSIKINGENLGQNAYAVQQQLGYLPENLPIYPDMIVADYLDYAAAIKGIAKGARAKAIKEAIVATDLGSRALDPIGKLSRGLKQRVGVAQAVLGRPRLLILDEPTNGLDPGQTQKMRVLIEKLSRRATIILSTHIMQEVEATCHRVLILNNGKLVLDQNLGEMRACGSLMLRTCNSVPELKAALRLMPQVATIKHQPCPENMNLFELTLHAGTDPDTAANNIARCVAGTGAKLFQLECVSRNLDDVFREVVGRES